MSHELRTPLNSLLILSDQLSKNATGNLNPRQMEYAKTIHASGNDLLNLINDILDLSKIESGTVAVDLSDLRFDDLHGFVERTFNHVAESRNLEFMVNRSPELPRSIQTDAKRLQQILKNLLSNAFKFTRQGRVTLEIYPAPPTVRFENATLRETEGIVAFSVADTGIGIPLEKQQIVFEAFQQADGSTSRKYGGTGLGLAISRELGWLLGGEIQLESAPGEGSLFTLYLPAKFVPAARRATPDTPAEGRTRPTVTPSAVAMAEPAQDHMADESADDRGQIAPGDRVLLILENDKAFAKMLFDVAHDHGYKALIAGYGATALSLTGEYAPHAITIDISLPDINGWRVLERLKNSPATRHIPVYVITTDEDRERALRAGAIGLATKPIQTREGLEHILGTLFRYVERNERELLLVDEDPDRRKKLRRYLPKTGVKVIEVDGPEDAISHLAKSAPDCVVLNPSFHNGSAENIDALVNAGTMSGVPVLIHGAQEISEAAAETVRRLARTAAVREIQSPERLLDLTTLVLHRRLEDLTETQRQTILDLHNGDKTLSGRKVLIVDDDIRNIFALTSTLEQHHMVTLSAETGRDAISILEGNPDIDVVLMDVMMPEMDGLDTTRAIRQIRRFRDLPIIAVTAKAMKGDREKCIEAGAWDYLAKPVDQDELLAMLRAWLVR
jgi:CheY-like chemotaxis protein